MTSLDAERPHSSKQELLDSVHRPKEEATCVAALWLPRGLAIILAFFEPPFVTKQGICLPAYDLSPKRDCTSRTAG
jgi:hypothetical protein